MPTPSPRQFQEQFFAANPNARSVMELFEYLPRAHFYAKDAHSRFIKVNRNVLDQYGVTDEYDVIGRNDHDFHPPAMAAAYIAEDQRVMQLQQSIPNQLWLVHQAHGSPQWYISSKTPLLSPNQNVMGIAGVMYPIATPEEQKFHFQELSPVIRYIESHYIENISMDEMARKVGLSTTHFNRRFRVLLRMSPTEYQLSLRVQEARRLLTDTTLSMAEIATNVGFYDQSHFAKRFHKVTGLTPTQYRRNYRSA